MPLAGLLRNCGEDPMETMRAIMSLFTDGFVTYDPETMRVELSLLGELVNAPAAGNA